jgi:3-isopropylmalate/(R)-2-methylmalate dehydratase small subunit
MTARALRRIESKTVVLPIDNVDTDQIIPARFLTTTSKSGLGEMLFADWRRDKDGRPRSEFILNRPEAQGARVLVAGRNFGCGSSREHAVWALTDFGFQAVIATAIADIFRRNATKNGLLPIVLDAESHGRLLANPGAAVAIDLAGQTLALPGGGTALFEIEPFARYCLMNGVDELQFLLSQGAAIDAYETRIQGAVER